MLRPVVPVNIHARDGLVEDGETRLNLTVGDGLSGAV